MNTPTKQFAWQNRDRAAHDLLQLVYHAPPSVSRRAASLLSAIRSSAILPQLTALVCDESLDMWLRIYALRAYIDVPGDRLAIVFDSIASKAIEQRARGLQRLRQYFRPHDLLDELAELADKHPSNRTWFFELLDAAPPPVSKQFYKGQLYCAHSDEFRNLVVERLLILLEAHPELVDLDVVLALMRVNDITQQWLDDHFDTILALCVANPSDSNVKYVAEQWSRLHDALTSQIEGWTIEDSCREPSRRYDGANDDYLQSPAYLFLMDLYERALDSDDDAYGQLVRIARRVKCNVPMRAVATYLIGKLREKYDVFDDLSWQLRHGNVHWEDNPYQSPVRSEAAWALSQIPTVATWEVLVDSYFMCPVMDLATSLEFWIAHVTDVLSGEDVPTDKSDQSRRRLPWFRALSQISADELDKL